MSGGEGLFQKRIAGFFQKRMGGLIWEALSGALDMEEQRQLSE